MSKYFSKKCRKSCYAVVISLALFLLIFLAVNYGSPATTAPVLKSLGISTSVEASPRHPKDVSIDSGKRETEADVARMQKMFEEIKAANPGLDLKSPMDYTATTAKPTTKLTTKM